MDPVQVSSSSKLSASAPAFVPAVLTQIPVVSQVEYYFSDLNLATTDHLMRFISKDAQGYVPISVVAGFNKIKAAISGQAHLATVLRNSSSKLVVSEDGKRVRRLNPITESDIRELQSRIVVAENLPHDHSHQNLIKIFSAAGSVKSIRTCPPRPSTSRSDLSNKLHAYIEYESVEDAEKAVCELNEEEANRRSNLRVRLMHRHTPKFEKEDGTSDEEVGRIVQRRHQKKGEHGRGRGRGRGRGHGRGLDPGPQHEHQLQLQSVNRILSPPGPRMPDGTRGFSFGRGNPLLLRLNQ